MFRFKQFTIADDNCAHRVGTDGVLLGAWARVEGARRILDIGTGSGLMALMAAQRNPQATVVGIDVDADSVRQAKENVQQSPFAGRVEIREEDVRFFRTDEAFDCILCNPPYFTENTLSPNEKRARARHTALLRFSDLIQSANHLLADDGEFHVIIPAIEHIDFVNQCFMVGMKITRQCVVRTVSHKAPKRVMCSFSRTGRILGVTEEMTLQSQDGGRSPMYSDLTKDFYL